MMLKTDRDQDRAAASFVIGTLEDPDRGQLWRQSRDDRALRDRIAYWEDLCAAMAPRARPVVPADHNWPAIETRLGWRSSGPAVLQQRRRLVVIGMVILALVALAFWRPWVDPFEQARELTLADKNGRVVWKLHLDTHRNLLRISTISRPSAGRSGDMELWLRTGRSAKLVSAGLLLEEAGSQSIVASPVPLDQLRGLAVSLEPSGGSKSGEPSGPMLFVFKLQAPEPSAKR